MSVYIVDECVVFFRTREEWGGLSNMAAGYPLKVNDVAFRTSEALYQACIFPSLPEVQQGIINEKSPMGAKMLTKPFKHRTRNDWDKVRVAIMAWTLQVKILQNESAARLLLATGTKPIVEKSTKDDFWGAMTIAGETNLLEGQNMLGHLLMDLRGFLQQNGRLGRIEPVPIKDFNLLGAPIQAVSAPSTVRGLVL